MAEIFVTLEEAAELEGTKYNTLVQRIKRNPASFKTKTEARDGGKDRVLVALSSLSKKARRGHKEKMNIDGRDVVIDQRANEEETPWYIDVDLNWYIEKFSKQYYQAVELGRQMQEFLDYNEGDRTAFAEKYAAKLGISQRTLYRYSQAYLEATAWVMKLQKYDCGNYDFFKVLSLCRKPKETHTFPSLPEEQRALIENIWFNKDFAANQGTVEMLYFKFEEKAQELGWKYPSYQTVARYINYLMEVKRYKNAHKLVEKGLRGYKNEVMMKASRDTSTVPVLGIVQGDGHTFDFWVKYTDPSNGKVKAIKPKMAAWIDTRSRVVMGSIMCKDVNSQIIKQSIIKLVYDYGVPECILIDNGKDYTSEEMLGRKRSDRHGLLSLDSEAKGFYKSIGIKDDHRSLPYQPWVKGPIERFFGTVCSMFSKWMASYTGTLTGSRTAGKIKKNIPKMLERDELITMEEAYALFEKWLNEVYHQREHSGLKRVKEKWKKPIELFKYADERYAVPAPPREFASMLLMKASGAYVRNIGIVRFGQEYMAPELAPYIGEKVNIKWNPDDVTKIHVYTKEGKKICEAASQELLLMYSKVPQKRLEEHIRNQKRQLKEDREITERCITPFELREGNEAKEFVGGVDLMVKNDKTVTLPQDKQFREEYKTGKNKQKQETNNEFFNKKAQDALSKLRLLG